MNRRQFLRKSIVRGVQGAAAVALVGGTQVRQAADAGRELADEKLTILRNRLDRLEKRHDKLVKATLVLAGVSIGLDVSLLL